MRLVAILLLCSCAASQRLVMRTCPGLRAFAADFVISGIGLAVSADQYSRGDLAPAAAAASAGMAWALSSNLAECR